MMRGQKPLMAYCKVTVPIETMEFMRPMAIPCPKGPDKGLNQEQSQTYVVGERSPFLNIVKTEYS